MTTALLIKKLQQDVDSILSNYVFTYGTVSPHQIITSQVETYLNRLKCQRDIRDYRVICNATNNVRGSSRLNVDVLVYPSLAFNYIQLSAAIQSPDDDYIFHPPKRDGDDNPGQ